MSTKRLTKVLMCSPDHFRVEYVINPWMKPGSVDSSQALEQWQKLKHELELLGVTVEVINQAETLPDMVFATDQGVVRQDRVLLSRFACEERQGETEFYRQWFADREYAVTQLEGHSFEGGEYLHFGPDYFVGVGFRTTIDVMPQLSSFLDADVHPLQLIDPRFYHLDTCFLPIDDETAFFFPEAFSEESYATLRAKVPNLLPFSEAEALRFGANSLVIGDQVLLSNANPTLEEKITKLGYQPVEINMGEFIKAGGGIHCLILPLEYQY
jgi:N-dimethylarginine dimethylaminohydrolase